MKYVKHGLCGKCGVYLLTCKANGKRYVGSSVNMGSRINQHFAKTCITRYANINLLYSDIRQYGKDGFDVRCLEFCNPSEKLEVERKWYHSIRPEYNMVEPDECPFKHKEVQTKAQEGCNTPSAIVNRINSHRSVQYREKCRNSKRSKMIPCRATDGKETHEFESLCEAARWLNRNSALSSVVSHIRYAIKEHGTAYGYRWEVMPK